MRVTGVFEVTAEIEEIGARVGDRIVVRPWAPRVALLQRTVPPHFAFDGRARLIFTRPALDRGHGLRVLRDRLHPRQRPPHLRLE